MGRERQVARKAGLGKRAGRGEAGGGLKHTKRQKRGAAGSHSVDATGAAAQQQDKNGVAPRREEAVAAGKRKAGATL